MDKLIVTAAITGGVTMPVQSPYLPLTPQQIADEAVRAAEAGAASVHIHARNPQDGKPTADPEVYKQILPSIRERCDAIVCITTGGGIGLSTEERIRVVPAFKPELATFNMGSMNFSIHPIGARYAEQEYRYAWEKGYIEASRDAVFRNTFADLEHFCKTMKEHSTKPECECYDVGHIYNTSFLVRQGALDLPLWLQFVTGVLGGIGSALEDIMYMKHTADRLIGAENYRWSVIGAGYPQQFQVATLAIMMGGHVRVGLEDNIFVERGVLATSNAQLVEKAVRLARELGREIATPDEARQLLGLKGMDRVGF
ncbi:MAG: 3-keto-5-aminohexanoate cleavage protein [Chloroflexi bacterium]|nr:3-keto-5-aminohexanoate cleavage protein [Chloroflexota bacterium]